MASNNGSSRPPGCVSIPVEIIRDSNSSNTNSHSRHNSPFRNVHEGTRHGSFSNSPPWTTSMNHNSSQPRFQPRHTPSTAYDRLINNSQFNQPLSDPYNYQQNQDPPVRPTQRRINESNPYYFSRSNEDLLSSPFDSIRQNPQQAYTSLIPPSFTSGFRPESDFLQTATLSNPLRRSYDAVNDFSDMHPNFPMTRPYPAEPRRYQEQPQPQFRTTFQTQHQPQQQQQQPPDTNQTFINPNIIYLNEFGVPTEPYPQQPFREPGHLFNEQVRSPAAKRGASPARSQPVHPMQQPQSQSQAEYSDEPELKMAKDTDGPIPMPPPARFSSQSTDQQVPSTDTFTSNNISNSSATGEPSRDSNYVALGKLEQIKQMLAELEQQVDKFIGSSRSEREYKVLDEQAVKIMLICDELVDVGTDIKDKRKEMIRNVQRVISKLESKVPVTPNVNQNSNAMETSATIDDSLINSKDQEDLTKTPSPSTSPIKETLVTGTNEELLST